MPHTAANDGGYATHDGYSANFDVAVRNAPVTYSRVQAINSDDKLDKAGIARANAAVSSEKPNGEPEQIKKFKDYVGCHFRAYTHLASCF